MRIDTQVPDYSKYFLWTNVPYHFAGRHLAIAFSSGDAPSLAERVCHVALALLLAIPLIGMIVALAEKILLKPSRLPPPHPVLPTPIRLERPTSPVPTSIKPGPLSRDRIDIIAERAAQLEARRKKNSFLRANRIEVHPPKNPWSRFELVEPFHEAWKSGKWEQIESFLQDPLFRKINEPYMRIEIRSDTTVHSQCSHLRGLIYEKSWDIFNRCLNHPNIKIDLESGGITALQAASNEGPEADRYVQALMARRANPFGGDPNCWTRKSAQLEAYIAQHERDAIGKTRLHRAIEEGNLTAFRASVAAGDALNVKTHGAERTPLRFAVDSLEKHPEMAKLIIRELIDAGCDVDAVDSSGTTPFLKLCLEKPCGWEEIALLFLQANADFFRANRDADQALNTLFNQPDDHPVKKELLDHSNGIFEDLQNRSNLATLFGMGYQTYFNQQQLLLDGGNYPAPLFEVLHKALPAFFEEHPDLNMLALQKSVDLAYFLATTSDLDEAWRRVEEALQTGDFPVIIPSGWQGHATAVVWTQKQVILGNRGDSYEEQIPAGLVIYNTPRPLDKYFFLRLLKNEQCTQQQLKKEEYLSVFERQIGSQNRKIIELKPQAHGNCTWSSSASLGLRAALLALKGTDVLDDEQNRFMKQVNHFTKWWITDHYVRHTCSLIDTSPYDYDRNLNSNLVIRLCEKIKAGKDVYGYYRRSLDTIILSGLALGYQFEFDPYTNYQRQIDLVSLYVEPTRENQRRMLGILAPGEFAIGSWRF